MTRPATVERLDDLFPVVDSSGAALPVKRARGIRGFGAPYLRGRLWWVRYHPRPGAPEVREPVRSERLVDAERLLKRRWKEIGRGRFVGPDGEKVTVNDLLDGLVTDYANNGRRTVKSLTWRLAPIRAALGTMRAVDVTGATVEAYKAERLKDVTRRGGPLAPATLNRELAMLKRAFRLALKQDRLTHMPVISLLAEHNARQGFVEPGVFAEIVKHLPDAVADAAQFAYITGWRREAVLSLQWQDVDLAHRRVRLRAEHSKNEDPGLIVLKDELLELMEHRYAVRALCPWVFHRGGRRLMDFRRSWEKACAAAGAPGLLFHDLCRSAIRNMDKAGVSQVVAMRVAGKKTDSVYRRYRIVDEQDIERALDQTQAMLRQARAMPGNVVPMAAR